MEQPPSMASSAKKQMELKEYEEQKRSGTTEASEAMFSVLKELGQGRPPKTTDISRAIDRINSILEQEERAAVASAAAPSSTATALAATEPVALDETGRRFLANTRNVLEQSKNLLQQRSADDQIQSFLMHSVVAPKQISAAAATSMDDEARKKLQDAQQSLRAIGFHGRKVILLLARSPEFRDSINTLISIAQRLLGKPEVRQEIVQAAKETTAAFGKGGAGQGGVETAPPRAVESVTSTTYHYESSERLVHAFTRLVTRYALLTHFRTIARALPHTEARELLLEHHSLLLLMLALSQRCPLMFVVGPPPLFCQLK
jgi:hypothetical protein